uniref:Secreted protein n=1 Tax=Panstrongylus lignarius TaxID=156445 RepID=A0A224XUN4_9HEMI
MFCNFINSLVGVILYLLLLLRNLHSDTLSNVLYLRDKNSLKFPQNRVHIQTLCILPYLAASGLHLLLA